MSIAILVAYAASLAAQPAVSTQGFVGTWELNIPSSDLGSDRPLPDYRVTRVISSDGPTLTIADHITDLWIMGTTIPQASNVVKYTTDGVEHGGAGLGRMPMLPSKTSTVLASWEGDNLVIRASGADMLGNWASQRRFFLSADGQQLTELDNDNSDIADSVKRLVFFRAR